jgi:hypothetical protein
MSEKRKQWYLNKLKLVNFVKKQFVWSIYEKKENIKILENL